MSEYIGMCAVAANGGFVTTVFARRDDGDGWDARVRVDRPLAGGRWRNGAWSAADAPGLGDPETLPAWKPARRIVFKAPDLVSIMRCAIRYRASQWQIAMDNAERWRRSFIVEPADAAEYERAAAQAEAEENMP